MTSYLRSIGQLPKKEIGLFLLHESVLLGKVVLFGQRLHQAKGRVNRRMVQAVVCAEVGLTGIHGRYGDATSNRDEKQSRQKQ